MSFTLHQLEEARRALDAPLFADLAGDAHVSFEFFPPKTDAMDAHLWEAIETLEGGELTVKIWLGRKPGAALHEVKAA